MRNLTNDKKYRHCGVTWCIYPTKIILSKEDNEKFSSSIYILMSEFKEILLLDISDVKLIPPHTSGEWER